MLCYFSAPHCLSGGDSRFGFNSVLGLKYELEIQAQCQKFGYSQQEVKTLDPTLPGAVGGWLQLLPPRSSWVTLSLPRSDSWSLPGTDGPFAGCLPFVGRISTLHFPFSLVWTHLPGLKWWRACETSSFPRASVWSPLCSCFVSRRNQNPLHNFDCSSLKRVLVCIAIFLVRCFVLEEKWCFLFFVWCATVSKIPVTLFGDLLHGISNDFDMLEFH